ncbi:MAG: COX15/CtaA family protein [Ilumatobacteraceae bacterium]
MAETNTRGRGLALARYRPIAWVAFASLYIIIVTGSLVRLTGSGLGCVDWPACNEERFVDVSSPHAAIEQLNRLFTGVVAASVIVAALAALAVRPRNRRLVRFAVLLVVGVVAQVVLGGIVVLTGLHPLSNMGHFLLSILLMTWALWLLHAIADAGDDIPRASRAPRTRESMLTGALVALTLVAIVTGTVVTGTGPHAGDEEAPRFAFAISSVARVHGASVLLTLATAVALGLVLRSSAARRLRQAFESFLFIALLQGGIGYLQYFTGVPVPLVALHVALSVAVWLSVLQLARIAKFTGSERTVAH